MTFSMYILILWLLALYATDANRDAKMSRFSGMTSDDWWKRHWAKWYNQGVAVLPVLFMLWLELRKEFLILRSMLTIAIVVIVCFLTWRLSVRYWGGVKWGSFVLSSIKKLFN